MARGRPRKARVNLPAHIDFLKIPKGVYWDPSGNGRWYILDPHPEGCGNKSRTVAQASARLSDLHAIAEARTASAPRGSIAYVIDKFEASLDFSELASSTKQHYRDYAKAIKAYPLKLGINLGDVIVDKLSPGGVRRIIDVIAKGKPAEKGADAAPGYPTKANHWLRYLRRTFGWGLEHDHVTTNPARGVKTVKEKRDHRMPELVVFRAVQEYARACSTLKARERGCLPPYLWAAMELAYQARLRGIEVITLTDAHTFGEDLQTNRRKGSRDNLVRKGTQLSAAIDALHEYRGKIWERKARAIPLRADQRPLFVGEDGEPLTKSGFNTAWQRMMRNCISAKVITPEQRFGLHGLKHRGVTDTKGDKKIASGHKTDSMVNLYNHEIPRVEPTGDP